MRICLDVVVRSNKVMMSPQLTSMCEIVLSGTETVLDLLVDSSYGMFPAIMDATVKKSRPNIVSNTNLDADDPLEDSDRDTSDDEEDDTAELMAELNRIKKEREAEQVISCSI